MLALRYPVDICVHCCSKVLLLMRSLNRPWSQVLFPSSHCFLELHTMLRQLDKKRLLAGARWHVRASNPPTTVCPCVKPESFTDIHYPSPRPLPLVLYFQQTLVRATSQLSLTSNLEKKEVKSWFLPSQRNLGILLQIHTLKFPAQDIVNGLKKRGTVFIKPKKVWVTFPGGQWMPTHLIRLQKPVFGEITPPVFFYNYFSFSRCLYFCFISFHPFQERCI